MSAPKDPEDKPTPAGRVKHDASGRAIWEWAMDTGRHALDSTSRLLKRLELPGLSIIDDEKEKKQAEEQAQRAERDSGFNPYGEVDPRPSAKSSDSGQPERRVPTFGGPAEKDPLANSRRSFDPYAKTTPARGGPAPKKPAPPRMTQPAKPAQKPGLLGRLFGRK
ncbi:MAG TPA: hypothetical protein VKO83_02725 [Steroidobacteraceae bacterium]|nr:hypothetical protein [Steroidobacteraceae bacterium]